VATGISFASVALVKPVFGIFLAVEIEVQISTTSQALYIVPDNSKPVKNLLFYLGFLALAV
jgi:hypothetical protein